MDGLGSKRNMKKKNSLDTEEMTDRTRPEAEVDEERKEEPGGEGEDLAEADAEEAPDPGQDEGGAVGDSEGDQEGDQVQALQAELDRLRDQHLRLAADFENYRKRANAELSGVWNRARADLVASLLEGLDDLQRVSQFTSEDATVDTLVEGVDLVERKFFKALTEAGLEAVEPEGERFDPNTMEAMMRVDVEEEDQDETVHQVLQKGYLFRDQLIRPARVSVYKEED
jgi:molecular chaperone GrpE